MPSKNKDSTDNKISSFANIFGIFILLIHIGK